MTSPESSAAPAAPPRHGPEELDLGAAQSQWTMIGRRFLRHRLAMIGAVGVLVLVLLVLAAPLIAHWGPNAVDLYSINQAPSSLHLLGTDQTGRDTFSRTLYGGRVSLLVGVVAVVISLVIATVLGGIAGYFRGLPEGLIMRLTDLFMTFPQILIVLVVAALFGPGLRNTILVIGLVSWPIPCRLVRARILAVRQEQFIEASRALGAGPWRILFRQAVPNAVDVLVVNATLGVANAILLEAGMSFLGLGVQPPTPSWGNLLNNASNLNVLQNYPWQWVPAGVGIMLTVLFINLIGDGMRDALDPRAVR